jgi:mRNA interferase MazF
MPTRRSLKGGHGLNARITAELGGRQNQLPAVLLATNTCTARRRGEVFRLHALRDRRGHEHSGSRYAVVVQSDQLPLSTWLVAPTSTSARAASFRPAVEIGGRVTRVLAEQTAAVDPGRLGKSVGYLNLEEMRRIDAALRIVLDL